LSQFGRSCFFYFIIRTKRQTFQEKKTNKWDGLDVHSQLT
jgi:hypothetical protein